MMLLSLGSLTLLSMNSAHAMSQNEGGWVNKQYNIKGGWEILEKNGKSIIKFTDNFQTKGGPDLKIFLSKRDITSSLHNMRSSFWSFDKRITIENSLDRYKQYVDVSA